jgi:translocation and assembly module TamB
VKKRVLAVWLLLVALVGGVAYVMLSEAFLAWAWQRLEPSLPEGIAVESVEGRLAGPVTLRGLDMETAEGARLQADRLRVDWRPWHLFLATLTLDELTLHGATYTAAAPAPEAEEVPPLEDRLAEWLRPVLYLHVRRLDLEAIRYRATPGEPPRLVSRLTGEVGLDAEGLYWRDLHLVLPTLEARTRGRVHARPLHPLNARLQWRWEGADGPVVRGEGRIQGSTEALDFHHRVTAPWAVVAEGRVGDPLGDPAWQVSLDGEELDLQALAPDTPGIASVHLRAEGGTEQARGDLGLTLRLPDLPTLAASGNLAADLAASRLTLRDIRLSPEGEPAALTAGGEINLGGDQPEVDLRGAWSELAWPLTGPGTVRSEAGEWSVTGSLSRLRARLEGDLNGITRLHAAGVLAEEAVGVALRWEDLRLPDRPGLASPEGFFSASGRPGDLRLHLRADVRPRPGLPVQVRGEARADNERLAIDELRLRGLDGRIRTTGEVRWRPEMAWELRLEGNGLDPGKYLAQWPGEVALSGTTRGRMGPEGLVAELPRLTAGGRLRGRPLDFRVAGTYRDQGVRDAALSLRLGESEFTAEGAVGTAMDLQWQLASPDLADFHPRAGGSLEGEGTVTGPLPIPGGRLALSGEGVRWGEYAAGQLSVEGRLHPRGEAESRLSLDVTEGRVGETEVSRFHAEGSGTPGDHRLHGAVASSLGQGGWDLAGAFHPDGPRWDFRLNRLKLDPTGLPPWELAKPVAGSAAAEAYRLDTGCLISEQGEICLSGHMDAEATEGRFRAREVALGYLLPLLPPGSGVEGHFSASGHFTGTAGEAATGELSLTTTAGRVFQRENGDIRAELRFAPSRFRVRATPEAVRGEGHLDFTEGDRIRTQWALQRRDPPVESPLSGRVRGRITDLDFLTALVPEVSSLEGQVELDIRGDGTLGQPEWDGRIRFTAEEIGLVTPSITLRETEFTLSPGPEGTLELSGSVRSGGGTLRLTGRGGPTEDGLRLEAGLQGEDFLAFDTRDVRLHLSPDLALSVRNRRVDLTGEVRIPRAEITPTDIGGEGAVTVSRDQVIVRAEEGTEREEALEIHSEVRILLGDRVRFEGFGLTGRLEGALTLTEQPGKPPTGTGEVRLEEGRYRAFGQNLRIETGRILFGGGPLTDPGLDVEAVRQPRLDITVGVHARGRLREPEFSLFSEPPMRQAEQLSWLVLGQPLDEASQGENAALNRAAIMLGIKGAQMLNRTIGSEAGLDTLTVETEPTETGEQASLVLGKYLSPRLYVSYGIGLFEPVNTFRVTYTLARHWEVVTESSTVQSSGDLFYTIESGR